MPQRKAISSRSAEGDLHRPEARRPWPARTTHLRRLVLMAAAALTAGCAGPPPIHDVAPAQLRAQIARDVPGLSRREVVIPHEISEETFASIHSRVDDLDDPSRGARALMASCSSCRSSSSRFPPTRRALRCAPAASFSDSLFTLIVTLTANAGPALQRRARLPGASGLVARMHREHP